MRFLISEDEISRDVNSAQALIDLNVAWCHLTGMEIRVDKCVTFGMQKYAGVYQQFMPNVANYQQLNYTDSGKKQILHVSRENI